MKILLISTSWQNPGDMFIRMGVEQLIKVACSSAIISYLDKEDDRQWSTAFDSSIDKIIWCGSPLFWSLPTHGTQKMGWWDGLLLPLMTQRHSDLAILGAGTIGRVSPTADQSFTNPDEVKLTVDTLLSGCALLTSRDDCVNQLIPSAPPLQILPCPAIFAKETIQSPTPHPITCNLMLNSGHFPELEPDYATTWSSKSAHLAKSLLTQDAYFCPHTDLEYNYATSLGWSCDRISHPHESLSHLCGATTHLGNRIHSCIVAASAGANSTCIGYDLRLRAAELCGCSILHLGKFPYEFQSLRITNAKSRYLELLSTFLK